MIFFFVRTFANSSLNADSVICLFILLFYLELPENVFRQSYKADTRQGVCVEYLRSPVTA